MRAGGDDMKTVPIYLAFICVLFPFAIKAQTTKVLPWNPPNDTDGKRVYHPEPILFVHGINDNDNGWEHYATWAGCSTTSFPNSGILQQLQDYFQIYWIPFDASAQIAADRGYGFYQATQRNYLQTFNYGDRPVTNTHDRQSFDHMPWNVIAVDRDHLPYTNTFMSTVTNYLAGDFRNTLDERINEIRLAYSPDSLNTNAPPKIVMVAHSLGGLLSHYYMLKRPTDHGVRRLVTLATPHKGSHYADWLVSYAHNPMAVWADMDETGVTLQQASLSFAQGCGRTAGYFLYGTKGAISDAVVVGSSLGGASKIENFQNSMMDLFWNNPVPKIEYIFNVYRRPAMLLTTPYDVLRVATDGAAPSEAVDGDGFVAPWSAAGKATQNVPSIWYGGTNAYINPVIFGPWPDTDHSDAEHHLKSIECSLDGVPYHWDGYNQSDWPVYAQMYGENQSFGKYFNTPSSGSTAYTDEPGIDQMQLCISHSGNPLLIDAKSSWDTGTGMPIKQFTNQTDLVGHQIITDSSSVVTPICTVGVKNHSQTPISSTHWIQAGNEYLPASQVVAFYSGSSPIQPHTNVDDIRVYVNWLGKGCNPDHCLVQIDADGNVIFQYGVGQSQFNFPLSASDNKVFFAAQGCNVAGLVTPQVEQVFNAPVDSATVVAILQKINQSEALSNGCHHATVPTRWTASIREWGTTDTGTITLNFFPTRTNLNVVDAWITNSVFNDYTFTSAGNAKTIRINDANAAPSQLIVSYTAYLGCDKMFTNSDNGYVPALGKDTLAGVPINEAFLNIIRQKLEEIIPLYQNTVGGTCGGPSWVLSNILATAGYPSGAWLKVVNGLLLPEHFTQLKKVADKLTREYSQFTLIANATLDLKNVYHLPAGTNMVYSTQIIHGSCIPARLSVTSGALPPGLFLTNVTDTSASITGTPTSILWPNIAVTNNFVITATDTNSCSTNQVYSLVVSNTLDSWRLSGWWASANIGDGLVSGSHCLSIGSDLVQWRYCSSLNNCGDPTDPTCYCMYPEATSAMAACQAAPRSLGHVCTDMGAEIGSVDETVYYGWWDSLATNYVTDCNLYGIINSATNLCYGPNGVGILSDTDSSFSGVIPISGTYSFWHGQTPTNYSGCCSVSGTVYAAVVTWASNGTSTGTSPSTYPVFLPCIPP